MICPYCGNTGIFEKYTAVITLIDRNGKSLKYRKGEKYQGLPGSVRFVYIICRECRWMVSRMVYRNENRRWVLDNEQSD